VRGKGKLGRVKQLLKSQNSSTKLQINLNFQYPMTKTLTTVKSHHFVDPGLSVIMPVDKVLDGSFVSNFEFGSLGFI
jgi:hypothetical protein